MSIKMSVVETSGAIDLTSWGFATGGPIEEAIGVVVTGAVQAAFADTPPWLGLPFKYGPSDDGANGPAVFDPLMIDVEIFLGKEDYDGTLFRCSLSDVIEQLIDDFVSQYSQKIEDQKGKRICTQTADRLRELADRLDAAIDPSSA